MKILHLKSIGTHLLQCHLHNSANNLANHKQKNRIVHVEVSPVKVSGRLDFSVRQSNLDGGGMMMTMDALLKELECSYRDKT